MFIKKEQIIEIMMFFEKIIEEDGNFSITINKVLSYDFVNSMEKANEIMSEIVSLGLLKDIPSGKAWLLTDLGRQFIRKNYTFTD